MLGTFPAPLADHAASAVIRFVGAVLINMHDGWIADDRCYLSEESMALLIDTVDSDDRAAIESGE